MEGDVIYLKVPSKYKEVYYRLLNAISDFGKEALMSCNKDCTSINNNVISCWNLFQSAIAANELNKTKEADLFIDYINKQLNIIYKNGNYNSIASNRYTIFIGAVSNSDINFDINNPNFIKIPNLTDISGTYTFNNPQKGYYGWICVPNKFKSISIKSGGVFDIPLNPYIEKKIILNEEEHTYNCYRITDSLVEGEHTITLIV